MKTDGGALPPFTAVPYLSLLIGILSLGFSGIFVSLANAPGAVTGFYRMFIATIILAGPFYRRIRLARPISRSLLLLPMIGGALFAADLIFWNTGVLMSGPVNPTLMGNTAPLWVGIGAILIFKERLKARFWLGLFLAMVGAAVILGADALQDLQIGLGTLFGLLAGVFYGGYYLVTQRARLNLDALTYFWLAAAASSLILLVVALIFRQPLIGYPDQTYWSWIGLGVISQAIGQFSFSYALGYLPASVVSPAGLGQPVVTALLAGPLLGQPVTLFQIVGGLTVIGGVYMVHRSRITIAS